MGRDLFEHSILVHHLLRLEQADFLLCSPSPFSSPRIVRCTHIVKEANLLQRLNLIVQVPHLRGCFKVSQVCVWVRPQTRVQIFVTTIFGMPGGTSNKICNQFLEHPPVIPQFLACLMGPYLDSFQSILVFDAYYKHFNYHANEIVLLLAYQAFKRIHSSSTW